MSLMNGRAFVFINPMQAARLGHVGWGFALDTEGDRFYFGSTDHLWRNPWWDLPAWMRYAHVRPGQNNDWWSATGSYRQMMNMMSTGHHLRHNEL